MNKKQIISHFNHIANNYDYYKRSTNIYYKTLKQAIKQEVEEHADILDVGCGTGIILEFLKPKRGLGIDFSETMIRIAKKKYIKNNNLQFKVFDITKKPIAGDFDYILLNDVIEHLSNPKPCLRNIERIMDRQSKLILTMANPSWEPILIMLEKLNLKMPEGPHKRISEKKLLYLLSINKLTVVNVKSYLPKLAMPISHKIGLIYVYIVKKT